MRVILAGQKAFGAAVYERIRFHHEVVAVWSPAPPWGDSVTRADRLTRTALASDLWVPPTHRNAKSTALLEADLFVAAHSHDFIGRDSRAATRLGGIGFHPSLLPRHRGRDAVRWTTHMRDPIAGGTVYWLTQSVDGGPIARQDWCHVRPDDDASALWRRELFPMGVRLLDAVLDDLDRRVIIEVLQDESVATWEPSWERPPLYKPELPQIGSVNGFTVHTTKEGAMGVSAKADE